MVRGCYEWTGYSTACARAQHFPVVVNFGYKPPKSFEKSVRESAKIRDCRLHFYRLIDGYCAIEVESKASPSELDASFLKGMRHKAQLARIWIRQNHCSSHAHQAAFNYRSKWSEDP